MMKTTRFFFAALCVFVIASCQKTYTCECTYYDPSTGQFTTTNHEVKGTIDEADNECRNTPAPGSGTSTCTLTEEGGYY